ncbi:MAG: flagellar basal-body rod protein FlgG [Dongiaceae bacterium]
MRAMNIAATGMMAQQTNVEVISNNIANINTTGFKRQRAEFQDLLYQNERRVGSDATDQGGIVPSGVQIGLGVHTAAVNRLFEQGNLVNTGNKLDVALSGRGFFQVTLPDGSKAYSRAGSFQLSPNGVIVNQDGHQIVPGITVPNDAIDITINESGQVLITVPGQTAQQNVGQLELANFPNEAGLQSIGDNLFTETAASGSPTTGVPASTGFGSVRQGFLETSNVNIVQEITDLITAQRAYEMNSKVIETSDQMMSTVTQIR